jgi:transcriptional regulator with XRE-family HTH domain
MNLGEKIYKLRSEKNLSQGDLAEILDVSRQSISKWENNNAVPELSKLIKMSELFQVSLDDLVKENSTSDMDSYYTNLTSLEELHTTLSTRKISGTILLSLGFITILILTMLLGIGNFVSSCLLASPLFICGIICFSFKKHIGLWCSWGVYFSIDVYLRLGTGLSWKVIFYTFRWTYRMNYMRLAIGWIQFLVLLLFICITIVKFCNTPYSIQDKTKLRIISSWILFVLTQCTLFLIPIIIRALFLPSIHILNGTLIYLTTIFIDWISIIAFTYALVNTILYRKNRKL